MTIEEVQVLITARTQGLQNEMNRVTRQLQGVQRQTNAMSNNMIRTFTNLKKAIVALGIGKAIAGAFNLARTYEASVQQVNRIFGLYSGALDAWIEKNAKTFGMARADAMQYASIYGNLVRVFETDSSKMTYYTTELMKATTIVASSTGRTVKDVSERIRSGILGNTEAIEDLGIYAQVAMLKTSNAFKEVANGRTWDQLTFQEQQQIRVLSILEQASNQFGDSIQNNMNYKLMQLTASLKDTWLYLGQAFMPIVNAVILEQASNQFGDSIQNNMNYKLMQLTASLKDTWLYLGQAFMPIVNAVLPILNAMAQALANVTAKLAAFMNALFGTNFHQGAGVDQVGVSADNAAGGFGNMADEAKDAGKEAEKAAKKAKAALAPFDELNVLSKNNGDSGKGSGGMGDSLGDIGSTLTPVTNTLEQAAESFADKLKAELEKLKALFKQGFEIGIGGNFEDRVNDIKNSIEGIKASLKDIFTDSDVVNGFNNLLSSLALNTGKITGSFVSIGTTIAQNLLGGLNKYLDQNKQFIKDRLVGIMDITSEIADLVGNFSVAFADIFSVFGGETAQQITANIQFIKDRLVGIMDITSEIADLVGNFSVAFADIFSVFGGETAQQITANIIGMFANGFLGAIELALRFSKDLLDTITSPIIENKDLIKETLEGMLVPIETITGSLKQTVEDTFLAIQTAYTTYVEPAFENIKAGLTALVENILTNYNTHIQPVLDRLSEKFAELMQGPIQGFINTIIDNIGQIIENGSILWKDTLEPMIEGLNNTLAPVLGVIVEKLGEFGLLLIEKVAEGAKIVSEKLKDISDWCVEHQEVIADIVAVVTAWATAWGLAELALVLFNAATTAWTTISTMATVATKAFSAAIAFLTSPIGLVVAAIAAVIAIVVLLIRHWDEVKEAATKCWDWIVEKWNSAGEWFSTNVTEPIKQFFSGLWEGIKHWDEVKEAATKCWDWIVEKWNSAGEWFSTNVTEPIKQFFSGLWEGIKTTGSNCWNGIVSVWNAASTWFNKTIIDPVKKAFTGMWDGIKKVCGDTWTTIKNIVKGGINGIIGFINKMIDGINSKLNFKLPEFFGGGRIGFEIPNIPPLAKGGVLRQSTIVEVGEYPGAKNNPEIVTPQNIMYDTVVSANAELASSFFQVGRMIVTAIENKDSNLIIGDEVIGKSSVNYINKQTKLKGVSPLNL